MQVKTLLSFGFDRDVCPSWLTENSVCWMCPCNRSHIKPVTHEEHQYLLKTRGYNDNSFFTACGCERRNAAMLVLGEYHKRISE